jgi:hypothetical protein
MNRVVLLLALLANACTPGDNAAPDAPIDWCEGPTEGRFAPLDDPQLSVFPDDEWTVDDDSSPTGQRVDVSGAAWLEEMPLGVVDVELPLSVLSGWGRLGAMFLRTWLPMGELPTDSVASVTDPRLMLVDLDADPPQRVPYELSTGEDRTQLLVQPLRILRPGARHALILTRDALAADGQCVAPSSTLKQLLAGSPDDARLARVAPRYRDALTTLGMSPGDVSAMTVFTTHDDVATLAAAAADAREQSYDWSAPPTCTEEEALVHCTGTFDDHDYRDPLGAVLGASPVATWSLPVDMWLPKGEGPFPTLILGHPLGGSRHDGGTVADDLTAHGFALIAADALHHGDHPTANGMGSKPEEFLGLNLADVQIDPFALRGSFEQTPLDRVQLTQLVRQHPDLTGDGQADLDLERFGYLGISLGGLLGSGTLALDGDLRAGVFSVGGGDLILFARDTELTATFHPLFVSLLGSEDGLDRFLTVAQAAVDPADPATLGTAVLQGRYDDALAPDVLLPVAMADVVVPPSTGQMLARGLALPHLPPVAWTVSELTPGPALPMSGNGPDGSTVGYFQFDRVTDDDVVEPATHDGTPLSPESWTQTLHFFDTWAQDGHAEVIDPYVELGTPPLP